MGESDRVYVSRTKLGSVFRFWALVRVSQCFPLYRIIHKSLRDFRPLRYSSRDGHAEGEHVNIGRDTPSFCPTLHVLDMSTLGDVADVIDICCVTKSGHIEHL